MSQRLRVNPITCEAHGMCAELLPERISLDDWGYPIVDQEPLPPELLDHARGRIEQWLKAGVIDQGRFAPTEQGSPQGGVISPVLMNVVLHGMEEAAGVRYITTGSNAGTARPGSPVLIRYADDALALDRKSVV